MRDALLQFLRSYQWHEVIFELIVIWICVYLIFRFLRGTRGEGVIKGFAVLLVVVTITVQVLGRWTGAERLNLIYNQFVQILAIVLIVVFQPELRQAMIRLGHARLFGWGREQLGALEDAIADAVEFLSKNQFGALIAIEREVQLGGLIEGGQALDAKASSRLLESIFWPNNPLHDLGVVIRGDRIVAANVQFPLAEEGSLPHRYGSRHRAALGLTMESDCLVIVVSEETGTTSIAERGRLESVPREAFRAMLASRLELGPPPVVEEAATPSEA
jgi:diadenylate cyclase